MVLVEELLLWLALGFIGYYIARKKNVGDAIKQAIEGATKLLTYVAIVILFVFIAGMLYGIFVLGGNTSTIGFWIPIVLFVILVIYYYL